VLPEEAEELLPEEDGAWLDELPGSGFAGTGASEDVPEDGEEDTVLPVSCPRPELPVIVPVTTGVKLPFPPADIPVFLEPSPASVPSSVFDAELVLPSAVLDAWEIPEDVLIGAIWSIRVSTSAVFNSDTLEESPDFVPADSAAEDKL
jgi:hypothetical protein